MSIEDRPPRDAEARFRRAYAEFRRQEGRGDGGLDHLLSLPYVRGGPWAKQWAVRARTFERFVTAVLAPREKETPRRSLSVLDLGAGNGWLCYRLRGRGHDPVAVDWRCDRVDGLGAAGDYAAHLDIPFKRVAASFQHLPFATAWCDLAVFNASLHYATSLERALAEAARVLVPTGSIVILDSPFYQHAKDGEAMVREKRSGAGLDLDADLLALPSIEYLTRERLLSASRALEVNWRRHRVRYPTWYEARPIVAALRGRRAPSRFDVWEGRRRT